MENFTARLIHPSGPYPFPEDPTQDRDASRDPRTVNTNAVTPQEALDVFLRDNPGFELLGEIQENS
jgi:hypothetical protein